MRLFLIVKHETMRARNLEIKTGVGEGTQPLSVGVIVQVLLVEHDHRIVVSVVEVGTEETRRTSIISDRRGTLQQQDHGTFRSHLTRLSG